MKRWLHDFLSLFFPDTCAGCDALLRSGETTLCTECRHEMPFTNQHLHAENEAFKTFYGRLPVDHVSCLLYFHRNGRVQHLIHKLKYKGREEIGTVLGHWTAAGLLETDVPAKIDAILPVPMHPKKLRQRGYNQVTTFGQTLSERLGIAYDETVLVKTIHSKTQSKKNFIERMLAKDKGFKAIFDERHHGKHYLIIDDILTTGATLESCGKALMAIPDVKISIVAMAMTFK